MADNQFINFNSQDVADMYRRNQYARMLQEQAAAPIERASYKGIEAPLHPVQGVAKMAAALLAGYQQNQMDERYTNEKAAAEQKVVAERERSNQAYTDFQAGIAPKPGFGASGSVGDYGGQEMPSQARSDTERLAHLLSSMGSADERVSRSAKNYLDYDAAQAQEKARLDETALNRLDKDAEIKRLQGNADREYKLDVARMGQDRNKQPPAPAGYRFTPTGDLMAIPGGPVDAKTIKANSAQETGRDTVSSVVDQLRTGYENLNARNSIVNPKNSVMSNLSAGLASSAPGQVASNLAGTEAQSIRNEIKMTRPLLLQQIMKATGMSAKQMDSNAELKLWLSTATDPGLDIKSNLAALDNIEKMYGMPKAATPAPTPAQSATRATVSNWNK